MRWFHREYAGEITILSFGFRREDFVVDEEIELEFYKEKILGQYSSYN